MKQRAQRRKTSHRYTSGEAIAVLQRRHMWRWHRAFRARLQHVQTILQTHLSAFREMVEMCHPPLDHSVGDYVTRGGDDVQLVTYISDDGYSGSYTCVVAPQQGWCTVGDEESNLTRRYQRVDYKPEQKP